MAGAASNLKGYRMYESDLAQLAIDEAMRAGARYVDVRIIDQREEAIETKNTEVILRRGEGIGVHGRMLGDDEVPGD